MGKQWNVSLSNYGSWSILYYQSLWSWKASTWSSEASYEGQTANFKAVIRVHQIYDDPVETAGWVYELTKQVRAVWGPDEIYVEVIQKATDNAV